MGRQRKFSKNELHQVTKQLLLDYGYEGYTFTVLANKLDISRAAIYKYYDNKDELLSEYMIYELKNFISELKNIEQNNSFVEQFNALIDTIFGDLSIYQIREIGMQIPNSNQKVLKNKLELEKLHTELYASLQDFIALGFNEKYLNESLPGNLILGLIFQTVNIPNATGIPHTEWVTNIKEVICHGIFKK